MTARHSLSLVIRKCKCSHACSETSRFLASIILQWIYTQRVTFVKFVSLTISFPCITSFSPEIFFHPFTCKKNSTPYTRTEHSSINLFPGSSSNFPCNHMPFSCSHNTPCNAVNFSIIKSSTLSVNVIIILKKVKQHIVRRMKHLTNLAQNHDGV